MSDDDILDRDMKDIIEKNQGHIPPLYTMTLDEFLSLATRYEHGDHITPIEDSFTFGFVLGSRAALNGHFKERE